MTGTDALPQPRSRAPGPPGRAVGRSPSPVARTHSPRRRGRLQPPLSRSLQPSAVLIARQLGPCLGVVSLSVCGAKSLLRVQPAQDEDFVRERAIQGRDSPQNPPADRAVLHFAEIGLHPLRATNEAPCVIAMGRNE